MDAEKLLKSQVKEKCGNRIVKVILERIQASEQKANKFNETSSSPKISRENQVRSLQGAIRLPSDSGPNHCNSRPQRNKTTIYRENFYVGNASADHDGIESNASGSDSEPKNTSDIEFEPQPLIKTKRKKSRTPKQISTNLKSVSKPKKLKTWVKVEKNVKIKCDFCPLNIAKTYLWQHLQIKHPEQLSQQDLKLKIKCDLCPLVLPAGKLYMHKKTQHPQVQVTAIPCLHCDLCSFKCTTQKWLEMHIIQFHVVDKPSECEMCFKSFLTAELLQKHVKRAHEDKNWNCRFCPSKSFNDSASLKKHALTFHRSYNGSCDSESGGNSHLCPVCDKWFLTDTDLVKHLRKPESKSVMECELCSEPVHTICGLNLHRQKIHSETPTPTTTRKPYQLQGIAKSADSDVQQRPHSRKTTQVSVSAKTEASFNTFSCLVCSALFSRRCDLNLHELQEKHRRWKCSVCAKLLGRKKDLKIHIQAVHSDARPYKCRQEGCSKTFKVRPDLGKHMAMHDTNRVHCKGCSKYILNKTFQIHVENCQKGDSGTLGTFSCDICSKTWGTEKRLKAHLLSHTDERPWPCKFCDAMYKCSAEANRHMKKCEFLSEDGRKQFARYSKANLSSAQKLKRPEFISCSRKIEADEASQLHGVVRPKTEPTSATQLPSADTVLILIKQEVDLQFVGGNLSDNVDDRPGPEVPEAIVANLDMVFKQEISTDFSD